MRRRYVLLDVFTDKPLSGNPLAVVLDAEGLEPARMQAIAAEFNLSETVFVLPAANPVREAQLRIFTPTKEMPFAGHPTVGTAVLLAGERLGWGGEEAEAVMVLEEGAGPVRCGVFLRGRLGHALVTAPHLPVQRGPARQSDAIAAALGLEPQEIGFENHHPVNFDAGVPYAFVPVQNVAVIACVAPQPALWEKAFGEVQDVYCYTRETVAVGRQFHARMFAPGVGITEDPATGSAVAAMAGVIHHFDALPSGTHRAIVEQGFEMGRPSLIALEMDVAPGRLQGVRIGGDAVVVGEGTLDLG
jgi:trans-2,3-dihydro-3-hydroxyanthranilate isomerase